MPTRVTVLCENTAGMPFGVIGEHGFACYIETPHGSYLFDTGQGFGILHNATVLGKDLSRIQAVMISHGHYDHTGGLPKVLQLKAPVSIWGHPDMFAERYWIKGGQRRDIGIPYRRSYLEAMGAQFCLEREWTQIGPGVHLTGEIPRLSEFEQNDPHMSLRCPETLALGPDPLKDDLSLVLESDRGLILILGCAHAGLVNIIEHVQDQLGQAEIYAVMGGTHLGFADEAQFERTLELIERYQIARVGASHCTGAEKASLMHAKLQERFFFAHVGAVLEG